MSQFSLEVTADEDDPAGREALEELAIRLREDLADGGVSRVERISSSATEYAFEGSQLTQAAGRPSVFTSALVDGLQTGEADLDADGDISVNDL